MNNFESAKWIWHNKYNSINIYINFDESIDIGKKNGQYILSVSCDTNYAVYINNKFANCGQYADYEDLKYYDSLDISDYLSEGLNSIRIVGYYQGEDSSTYRRGIAGMIYELRCEGDVLLASSEKTEVSKNTAFIDGAAIEKISGQLGYSFHYDSRNENQSIDAEKATAVDKTYNLLSRPIKKLVIFDNDPSVVTVRGTFMDTLSAEDSSIGQRMLYSYLAFKDPNVSQCLPDTKGIGIGDYSSDSADGVFAIIDIGAENTGLITLDIDVPKDCQVLIGWGEHLEDMRVRSYVGGRNFCASYFASKGHCKFTSPFRRCGLRYLQIHVYAPSFTLYYAGIKPTLYPVTDNVQFRCADSLHNKIYDVSVRTLLMCMHEHYEDCPWREQALYSMDSRNQMLCGYYAFRETEFARASIRLMAHSIREDNMLELCSPAVVGITIPSFSAIFLTQLHEYFEYSGDTEFVTEMLPTVIRIADEFIARSKNEKHLIRCFKETKYWNFYEWQQGLEGSISGDVADEDVTYDAPLNAFVSFGLRAISKIFEKLGDKNSSDKYYSEHIALNTAINNEFYDDKLGVYASYSKNGTIYHYAELTNSLIVYADAVSDDKLERVLEKLTDGSLIEVTISHSIFKYDALMRDKNKYARFVFAHVSKMWGHMLYNNATTFWETIDGACAFGNAGSLCHAWSAIPIYLYFKYALNENPQITGLYECHTDF